MKRAIAASALLLLLVPALPLAGALGTPERWDADRSLRANLTVPPQVDLVVGPGVNVSFEPEDRLADFSPVFLNIGGIFEVCGTAEEPCALRASRDFFYSEDMPGGYLNLTGNGKPDQLSMRNCSFENIVIIITSAAGQFTDCVFNGTYLYVADSTARFVNCSFEGAAMSIYSPSSQNQTVLSGCVFDATGWRGYDPYWGYYSNVPAIKVSGYVLIERCLIMGFGIGIQSISGVPVVTECTVTDCGTGIDLTTPDLTDTPVVEHCVVQNCSQMALRAYGNVLLRDCTLRNSTYGLELFDYNAGPGINRTLLGNRVFGNGQYGVSLQGAFESLGDTRFDDGNGTVNREGRVVKWSSLTLTVSTRGISTGSDAIHVNLTDATGETHEGFRAGMNSYIFSANIEYTIDNSGQRRDYYPAVVRAEWNGAFCETTVLAGARNVTMTLTALPDLVPVLVSIDPPSPRAGDWVAITCSVNNTGAVRSTRVQARFTLDGERLDLSDLFPVGPGAGSSVKAVDWKARRGVHTVTVWLDPENAQEENDESNNNLTFNFSVGEAPPRPAGGTDIAFAGAATAVVLALACAGGFLLWRRRRPGKEG